LTAGISPVADVVRNWLGRLGIAINRHPQVSWLRSASASLRLAVSRPSVWGDRCD
jgi:hypothetical protein